MAVEIHEDQPMVESSIAWPRQLWIPAIAHGHVGAQYQNPAQIQFGQIASGTVQIPTDFTALSRLDLVMYPSANANYTMSTTLYFGSVGEAYNIHTQNQAPVIPMVINVLTHYDLLTLFAALLALLVPGDDFQVRTNNQTGNNVYVYGLDMRYT